MDGQRRFAVIGTDARLAAAGRALARAGFAVGGPEQKRRNFTNSFRGI